MRFTQIEQKMPAKVSNSVSVMKRMIANQGRFHCDYELRFAVSAPQQCFSTCSRLEQGNNCIELQRQKPDSSTGQMSKRFGNTYICIVMNTCAIIPSCLRCKRI